MSIPQIKKQLIVPVAGVILFALARLLLYLIRSALVARFGSDQPRYSSLVLLETLTLIGVFACAAIITVRLLTIVLYDLVLQRFYKPTSIDRTLFSLAAYAASTILIGLTVSRLSPEINLGALFTTSVVFLLFLVVGIPLYIFVVNKNKDIAANASRAPLIRLLIAPLILTPIVAAALYVVGRDAASENRWVYRLTALTGVALCACVSFLVVRPLNEIVFFDYRIRKGHQASVLDRNVFSAIAYLSSWPLITSVVLPSINVGSFFSITVIVLICVAVYLFLRFSGYGFDQRPPSDNKRRVRSLVGLFALIVALTAFYFINPWSQVYSSDARVLEFLLGILQAMLWMGVAVCVMQLAAAPIFKFIFRLFNGHEPGPITHDIFSVIAHLFVFAGICLVFVPALVTTVLFTTMFAVGLWKSRKALAEWLDRSGAGNAVGKELELTKSKHANVLADATPANVLERPLTPDTGDSSARLRHAIENRFPYPIARSFYQLRGVDDWLAEIPQMANVLGVTLEHLAIIALSEYLSGEVRDVELNRRLLETFQKPLSHGAWAGVLRDTLIFLRKQPQENFTREMLPSYFPSQGEKSASLKDIGDKLVQLRNDLLKRTGGARPAREKHHLFKDQLVKFLQSVAFLKDYPLVSVKSTTTQGGIKSHSCYLHVGFHDPFEQVSVQCDLDLENTRVVMLNPQATELLYLYPFYAARECDECGSIHLFHFNKMDKGRIEYAATEGHSLRDATAGADLITLLEKPLGLPLRHAPKYLCLETREEWHRLSVRQHVNGKYEIVKHLRRGGMADVYQVTDLKNQTPLALKLLPFQFLSDRTMLQRFRQEAARARSLEHPNITRVFDYGEDLVDHYLVMELADGWKTGEGSIALDVGELPKPLDEKQVIAIVKQACDGLDYIHRQQIIHRDIKPGNLLLFDDDCVKLADFGIARARESITLTMTGLAMGTPEYMSPEQAEGKKDLSFASDIYSMGIVMYELLAGHPPFKRATPLATAVAHLREPVPAITQSNPHISAGLQRIVMKCLEKEPHDRYDSARSLYQEIDAYERGEATPQGASKTSAVRYLEKRLSGHEGTVNTLAFAPDGSLLASGGKDRTIRLWDPQTATLRQTVDAHEVEVTSVTFSPDGQLLISCSYDKTVKVWDARTLELKRTLSWPRNPTFDTVAFSPDGRFGASGGEVRERIAGEKELSRSGEICLWDAQTLALKRTLTGHAFTVSSVAFSHDSAMLASGSWDQTIKLWDVFTGELKVTLSGHNGAVNAVAFSPNGEIFASASEDQTVKLWNVQTGETTRTLAGHSSRALALAFSPDGQTIASGGGEHQKWGEVKFWDARTGKLKQTLRGHGGAVLAVAFSPNGETLASGSSDSKIGLWSLQTLARPVTENVLWVCDDSDYSAAAFELRRRGMNVMVAPSTDEAMSILLAGHEEEKTIDFAVSEIGRSADEGDSIEADLMFIRAVRQAGITLPIYVLSTESDSATNSDEIIGAGGNGYVRFNTDPGNLDDFPVGRSQKNLVTGDLSIQSGDVDSEWALTKNRGRARRLLAELNSPDPDDRADAARSLGEMKEGANLAVPALTKALRDTDNSVRRSAADALGEIGSAAKNSAPALVQLLNEQDEDLRISAAFSLMIIDREATAALAIPVLIEAMKHQDEDVRSTAGYVLRNVGPEAKGAVPVLIGLLNEPDKNVRKTAALVLRKIGPAAEDAVPGLIGLLADEDSSVRWGATMALKGIGPKAQAAIPSLKALLKDQNYDVRTTAAAALAELGGKS